MKLIDAASRDRSKKRKRRDDDISAIAETDSARAKRTSKEDDTFKGLGGHISGGPHHSDQLKTQISGKDSLQGMRFSDAAGYDKRAGKPWYNTSEADIHASLDTTGRDVWGNEDPRRLDREAQRTSASDPLAAMKRGVKQLKKAENERAQWKAQRESDLTEVEHLAMAASTGRSQHSRRRTSDTRSVDDFDLDGSREGQGGVIEDSHSRRKHRHHHHHRRHRDDHLRHDNKYRSEVGSRERRGSRRSHREKV